MFRIALAGTLFVVYDADLWCRLAAAIARLFLMQIGGILEVGLGLF